MDKQFVFWLLTLIVGVSAWFVWNLDRGYYNYEYFPQLRNNSIGRRMIVSDIHNPRNAYDETSDYIAKTNADQRLYDLIASVNLLTPFSNDQYYHHKEDELVSGGPVANQTLCGQQLAWLIDNLMQYPNYTQLTGQLGYELNYLMDTYGGHQASTYQGVQMSLGSHVGCLRAKLQNGKISNRYCISRFSMKSWPEDNQIYPPVTISFGICIPESCDTSSFGVHKKSLEFLAKYHQNQKQRDQLIFESMFCEPDERSELRKIKPMGHILIWLIIGWLSIILGACLLDEYYLRRRFKQNLANSTAIEMMLHKHQQETFIAINSNGKSSIDNNNTNNNQHVENSPKNNGNNSGDANSKSIFEHLIEGLTVRHSLKVFKQCNFRVRYDRGERVRVDLSSIDFMKTVFILSIVMGHGLIFSAMYSQSLRGRLALTTGSVGSATLSIGRFVDTFFVFFGLLTTFTILRKFNMNQLSNPVIWIMANIGIYLRIAPLFMLVYIFNREIMPYMGSGPFWDYGVELASLRYLCRHESWIKIIPPFGSFGVPPAPACNPPSWFLVSYTQIALLLPLLTYLLYRIPRTIYRILLIAFLVAISSLNVGYRLYVQEVVASDLFTYYTGLMMAVVDKYESSGYMDTLTRLGNVAIGCSVGYILHLYSIGCIQQWPRWLTSRYFIFFNLILHTLMYLMPMLSLRIYWWTGYLASLESFVIGNMVAYTLWPTLNGLLLLSVTTVHAKHVIVRFMSHPVWHIFNKLGLCMLLVQYEVIVYGVKTFEHGPTNGFVIDAIKVGSFGLFFSVIISFMIHILFEAPVNHIAMLILGPHMLGRARSRLNEELNAAKLNSNDHGQDNNLKNHTSSTKDGVLRME